MCACAFPAYFDLLFFDDFSNFSKINNLHSFDALRSCLAVTHTIL